MLSRLCGIVFQHMAPAGDNVVKQHKKTPVA